MELDKMTKEKGIEFTPEQKEAYMLEGGTPHLDGNYTVFGEVIQGMVVDTVRRDERVKRTHEEHKDQVNETHRKISIKWKIKQLRQGCLCTPTKEI